jgi:glucokinase-like ROK family protein
LFASNGLIASLNVRVTNKAAVLNLIRFTPGGIARAEIARQLELSRAAISSIVNDLLAHQVIRETEDVPSTSGRRPILLEINPECGYVVGVDIGATHVTLVLADLSARVLEEIEFPFNVSLGPDVCLPQVDSKLREFLTGASVTLEEISAIGVGVPGPVVSEAGGVVAPPIMPGWDNFPIQSHLESLWGRPVMLNNDAELGALGEWAYGAGRNEKHLLYIKVGYGIGAGLLIGGQIYRGATGSAGEIGHIVIMENGPLCACGNRGCLEAIAGGRAIADRARNAVRSGRRTHLASIKPIESISALDVAKAARKGDLVAQEIVAEAGEYLGIAIVGLINLINPSMIVIGGGVAEMGDLFIEPIRQAAMDRSLPAAAKDLRITAATLGRRASSMGAVVQAISIALHHIVNLSLK